MPQDARPPRATPQATPTPERSPTGQLEPFLACLQGDDHDRDVTVQQLTLRSDGSAQLVLVVPRAHVLNATRAVLALQGSQFLVRLGPA